MFHTSLTINSSVTLDVRTCAALFCTFSKHRFLRYNVFTPIYPSRHPPLLEVEASFRSYILLIIKRLHHKILPNSDCIIINKYFCVRVSISNHPSICLSSKFLRLKGTYHAFFCDFLLFV